MEYLKLFTFGIAVLATFVGIVAFYFASNLRKSSGKLSGDSVGFKRSRWLLYTAVAVSILLSVIEYFVMRK